MVGTLQRIDFTGRNVVSRPFRRGLIILILIGSLVMLAGSVFAESTWSVTDHGYKVWNDNPQPNESVTWSGGADANGYATGQGVLQWFQNGKPSGKYEGTMLNGRENGKGIYVFEGNSQWAGDRYEGDFVDNKRTGKGIYTWATGDRYDGDWIDGKQNGKGSLVYGPNSQRAGDRYDGDFVDGKMTPQIFSVCTPGLSTGLCATAPVALTSPYPKYPEAANKAGIEAHVTLRLIIADDGRPSQIRVVKGAGHGFDEAAVNAVRRWTFSPGTYQGKPVPVMVNVEVNFKPRARAAQD
jgi:TonB family protein